MQRISVLLLVLLVCFATAMQAQAPAPKPGPEVKKLGVFTGHWTYEAEYKPGLWGPGGKGTGMYDGRMILGGFYFQGRATGETQGLEIIGYDAVNKNYPHRVYMDNGSCWSGVFTVSGNTWTFTGQATVGEKQYQARGAYTLAADLASMTHKDEISVDGKAWSPFGEIKFVKVQPAAKK